MYNNFVVAEHKDAGFKVKYFVFNAMIMHFHEYPKHIREHYFLLSLIIL
jgi:hypothetical protein